MNEPKPTHLDLFSGIGGFSLAFEAEGFQTIGFAEIDPYASAVLRKHWPHVPNYGDVRNAIRGGHCSVLTGGFPCQPFSAAGLHKRTNDDRFLWPAMLDVIRSRRPDWVLGENVTGIIGMDFCDMLTDLEKEDYISQTFIVPACAAGAFHARNRMWIAAHSKSIGHVSHSVHSRASDEIEVGNHVHSLNYWLIKNFGMSQNPTISEVLMGFPKHWTKCDFELSETPSTHQSPESSPAQSGS